MAIFRHESPASRIRAGSTSSRFGGRRQTAEQALDPAQYPAGRRDRQLLAGDLEQHGPVQVHGAADWRHPRPRIEVRPVVDQPRQHRIGVPQVGARLPRPRGAARILGHGTAPFPGGYAGHRRRASAGSPNAAIVEARLGETASPGSGDRRVQDPRRRANHQDPVRASHLAARQPESVANACTTARDVPRNPGRHRDSTDQPDYAPIPGQHSARPSTTRATTSDASSGTCTGSPTASTRRRS